VGSEEQQRATESVAEIEQEGGAEIVGEVEGGVVDDLRLVENVVEGCEISWQDVRRGEVQFAMGVADTSLT
jgi:hypothetical protein